MSEQQLDLEFVCGPDEGDHDIPGLFADGLDRWRAERRVQLEALARELGLPLGHEVRLTLRSGPELRGKLVLASELLWVERPKKQHIHELCLAIGKAEFHRTEIESCVRLN